MVGGWVGGVGGCQGFKRNIVKEVKGKVLGCGRLTRGYRVVERGKTRLLESNEDGGRHGILGMKGGEWNTWRQYIKLL